MRTPVNRRSQRSKQAPPPPARLRGRWWFLAVPASYTCQTGTGDTSAEQMPFYGYRREPYGILHPPGPRISPPYGCAICPPFGTLYRLVYLLALPAKFHSQHDLPTPQALKDACSNSDLENISQSYDDLFSAINEIPLLPLDLGMPVRIQLWIPLRFVVDQAGVLRFPADIERHPTLGVWDQGTTLDKLLRWHYWWAPEQIAADWAPDRTRYWLQEHGGIPQEDEARLIDLAERAGMGAVATGQAYRCGRARCVVPIPKGEGIQVGSAHYHAHCWQQDKEEHENARQEEKLRQESINEYFSESSSAVNKR